LYLPVISENKEQLSRRLQSYRMLRPVRANCGVVFLAVPEQQPDQAAKQLGRYRPFNLLTVIAAVLGILCPDLLDLFQDFINTIGTPFLPGPLINRLHGLTKWR
jgi:hypothetical protein